MCGSVFEKEMGKRERLVQTYIVLFGLLLAYNQNAGLQKNAMWIFIVFLNSILLYYSLLLSDGGLVLKFSIGFYRGAANFFALIAAGCLSTTIGLYSLDLGKNSIESITVLGIGLFCIIFSSLYIPSYIMSKYMSDLSVNQKAVETLGEQK